MTHWLERIYDEHRDQLFRCAWLILRDSGKAEDAVHAAFERMIRANTKPTHLKAYVFSAVRNVAIDDLRRCENRNAITDNHFDTIEAPRESNAFAEELAVLSADKREVVEHRLRVGLTFTEIAELLGESVSTVTSRYRRALEELRKLNGVADERH